MRITLTHFTEAQAAEALPAQAEQSTPEQDGENAVQEEEPEKVLQSVGEADESSEDNPAPTGKEDEITDKARQTLLKSYKENLKKTWSEDAEKLRELYPSFNMAEELRGNTRLGAMLSAGIPLKDAYEATHLDEIIGAAMRYAARKASEKTANSFMSGTARPAENGIMNNAPSVTRTDVRALTEKDILKILDRVSKGETVSF